MARFANYVRVKVGIYIRSEIIADQANRCHAECDSNVILAEGLNSR